MRRKEVKRHSDSLGRRDRAIAESLKLSKVRRLLILSDSKEAIAAVTKASRIG